MGHGDDIEDRELVDDVKIVLNTKGFIGSFWSGGQWTWRHPVGVQTKERRPSAIAVETKNMSQ